MMGETFHLWQRDLIERLRGPNLGHAHIRDDFTEWVSVRLFRD